MALETSFARRILSWFSPQVSIPSPPPAGMRTVPCTRLDSWACNGVLTASLLVDARLDAKIMEQNLSTLVERKFPRAGAQLALRNGVYEFQIPRTFDADTPPIVFTVDNHSERYPSATRPELPTHFPDTFEPTQPSIHSIPELEVYVKSRQSPTSLDGFLVPNTPSLHVHVATFDDLTFIGVTVSHMAFDGLGLRTVIHAWTRLLNGDAIDTILGMEWYAAPFEAFTGPTAVTTLRGYFEPEQPSWVQRVVRSLMQTLWGPKDAMQQDVTRLVRVPKVFLDEAKREINYAPTLQGSSEWVGTSDVLMAWWFKVRLHHINF
ncbi:hypothetical protein B0H17DRAFT_1010970 [Mycena rosella]|uniref:Uncharacterized protein n=1 Tax=Mycena rosella TaxID=1033263 RepID=A0AAD7DIB7_MYCRO|nr:hypothetical protein B0H17DRAFT_1010970 [Mycena rosella]